MSNLNTVVSYIVVIPCGDVNRTDLENIDSVIPFDADCTPEGWVVEQLGTVEVDVYTIDEFVDLCNDQEFNPDLYWIGHLQQEIE